MLIQGLVALRCNCNHSIRSNLNLGLMSLQQATLIALTLLKVLDAVVYLLLIYQLLIRFHEILFNHLCPCLIT